MSAPSSLAAAGQDRPLRRARRGFPRSLFVQRGRAIWSAPGSWATTTASAAPILLAATRPATCAACRALFPDKRRVLHLFSGRVDLCGRCRATRSTSTRRSRPPTCDDAQNAATASRSDALRPACSRDPPYSIEDAERYQTTMVKRNVVMRALQRVCAGHARRLARPGAADVPQVAFDIEGVIGMVKSTNHRFRVVTLFRRRD